MKYLVPSFKFIGLMTVLGLLSGFMGFVGLYLNLGPNLPKVEDIRDIRLQTPMTIYSKEGEVIAEFGDKRRIPVTLSDVPQSFIHALIATEDKRFFEHSGVDFMGVLRAFVINITTGTRSQGASTITQLVARNVYLDREKTFTRKIREIFLAWKIESEISKQEILELFINKAHFSHRAYGLGAAAQVYYGKDIKDLELHEVAVLAGIPKGESIFNPISSPENAFNRRNHVLGRMLAEGYISSEQYEAAKIIPISATKHGTDLSVSAPYIAEMVRREMITMFGREAAYNNGYKVYTTIRSELQDIAQQALRESLIEYDERHGYRGPLAQLDDILTMNTEEIIRYLSAVRGSADLIPAIVTEIAEQEATLIIGTGEQILLNWENMSWASKFIDSDRKEKAPETAAEILAIGDVILVQQKSNQEYRLSQIPEVSGGFVALSPKDGAIEALTGGFDFEINQFNMITQARRQPGSNIKPFIYSAALEKGYTAASVLNDAPFVKEDVTAEDFWRPKNDSGRYKGLTRLRDALRFSNNSISVRLINEIGPKFAENYLINLGLPDQYMEPYTSLALGSASFTPLEVVTSYAVFANGGYRVSPYFIERIETPLEDIVFKAEPVQVCRDCERLLADMSTTPTAAIDVAMNDDPLLETLPLIMEDQNLTLEALPLFPIDQSKIAPRVIEERNAFIINSMMKDVIHRGTAWRQLYNSRSSLLKRNDIGGKTGTTNDAKDAWFSGFNGDHVATAWVGFADYSLSLGSREYGGKAALPIWQKFMEHALRGQPENAMAQPPGIVNARINPLSGKLANASTQDAIFEIFRSEQLPEKEPDQNTPVTDKIFEEVLF